MVSAKNIMLRNCDHSPGHPSFLLFSGGETRRIFGALTELEEGAGRSVCVGSGQGGWGWSKVQSSYMVFWVKTRRDCGFHISQLSLFLFPSSLSHMVSVSFQMSLVHNVMVMKESH